MLFVALSEDPVDDKHPLLLHKYIEHIGEDSPATSPFYENGQDLPGGPTQVFSWQPKEGPATEESVAQLWK